MAICYTKYVEDLIDEETANNLYVTLHDTIQWEDGVKSKYGFTRKAKPLSLEDEDAQILLPYILEAIQKLKPSGVETYGILGIYLNLYEDGKMYTPNHSHPKQHQIVISLGAERTLKVGTKSFKMKNGSAIIFGASIHGVPKEPEVTKGRISIATFMVPNVKY